MFAKVVCIALISTAIVVTLGAAGDGGKGERGKELFVRRCSGCHAPDSNKEGPRLRGVYGAGIRWDDASLDRWLSDPDAMVPDTDMAFRLADGDERKAVIAYLKGLGNQ
jgi:cytochrome c